jgi:PAS domain S-box-containing protein
LDSLTLVQTQYSHATDSYLLFSRLLDNILSLTQSDYGFIGELFSTIRGDPYLKIYAITNLPDDDKSASLYNECVSTEFEFYNLDNLFGAAITTGKPVISDNPAKKSKWGGIPKGYPPLKKFMGLPIYYGKKLIGMVAIANRPGGYDQALIDYVQPFLTTCANIIESYKISRQRKETVEELKESEEKFKSLAEQSPNMIFINKVDKIVYTNKKCEEILGYKKEEFYAHDFDFRCLIAPESVAFVRKNLQKQQRGKDIEPYEYTLITKNGKRIEGINTTKLIKYENEDAILGIITDISERKHAEEMLIKREAYLEVIAYMGQKLLSYDLEDSKSDWCKHVSPLLAQLGTVAGVDRIYIFQNHRDENGDLLCSQCCEWIEKGIEPQIDNPDLQSFSYKTDGFSRWAKTMSQGDVISGLIRDFPPKERQELREQNILSLLAVPIFTNDGWWGFLGLDDCTTEREWDKGEITLLKSAANTLGQYFNKTLVEAEKATLQAQLNYSERMDSIGTLARGIAHNFNNILCGILGYISLTKPLMEVGNEFYESICKIEFLAQRASILTKKLLDFAQGKQFLSNLLDCTHLISSNQSSLQKSLNKNITVEINCQCEGNQIMGDEELIRQAILNLCLNAQDAMPNGGKIQIIAQILKFNKPHAIESTTIPPGRYFLLKVIDTGKGMSQEILDHILEPFFTTQKVGEGSGLGLAIVYGIMKNHKGYISIQSKREAGTTCTLYFPVAKTKQKKKEKKND